MTGPEPRRVRAAVVAQVKRLDEDAWVALASRGLLRRARKDLQSVTPEIAEDGELFRIRVGSHVVAFDARGPAAARCSCPSETCCRHVVAAGLWLAVDGAGQVPPPTQEASETAAADTAAVGTPAEAQPVADVAAVTPAEPHTDLIGFDAEALTAHAGRAGYRWALRYALDLDLGSGVRVESGAQVVIALAEPPVTFRYAGGGLAALIADTRLPRPGRYAAAAVLAYQRAHGVQLTAPLPPKQPAGDSGDLDANRRRLRPAVSRLLTDTVGLGIAHLSPSTHQRYETVAIWAQGVEYHRLALLLRRLADDVELLLHRSARADEERLLDETALAYALVNALEVAAASGEAPARLVGRARAAYESVPSMELLGLGSLPWRAASGYRGLTTLFWWPEEARFVSLTDARPDSQRGYDPRARYTASGPWSGLPSPAAAAGHRVRLRDARLGGTGRLSAAGRSRAELRAYDGKALAALLPVLTEWDGLEERSRQRLSLLDLPDPLLDWAVLEPAGFGPVSFDEIRQTVTWIVLDATGAPLRLELAYTPENVHAIERLESLTEADLPAGTLVVSRCRLTADGLTGEPLSLVRPDQPAGGRPVDVLHFDPPRQSGRDASRQRRSGHRGAGPPGVPSAEPTVLPPQLENLRAFLLRQAERGIAAPGSFRTELAARHQALRDVGFHIFPASAPGKELPAALLRSHFLVLQTAHLLTPVSGEDRPTRPRRPPVDARRGAAPDDPWNPSTSANRSRERCWWPMCEDRLPIGNTMGLWRRSASRWTTGSWGVCPASSGRGFLWPRSSGSWRMA